MDLSKEEEKQIREEMRAFVRHSRPHLSEEEIFQMSDQELSLEYRMCYPSMPGKSLGHEDIQPTEEEKKHFEDFIRRGSEQIRKYKEKYNL